MRSPIGITDGLHSRLSLMVIEKRIHDTLFKNQGFRIIRVFYSCITFFINIKTSYNLIRSTILIFQQKSYFFITTLGNRSRKNAESALIHKSCVIRGIRSVLFIIKLHGNTFYPASVALRNIYKVNCFAGLIYHLPFRIRHNCLWLIQSICAPVGIFRNVHIVIKGIKWSRTKVHRNIALHFRFHPIKLIEISGENLPVFHWLPICLDKRYCRIISLRNQNRISSPVTFCHGNDLLTVFPSLKNSHDIVHIIIFPVQIYKKQFLTCQWSVRGYQQSRIVWKIHSIIRKQLIFRKLFRQLRIGILFYDDVISQLIICASEILLRYFRFLLRKFWIHLRKPGGFRRDLYTSKVFLCFCLCRKICFRHILFCRFCCFKSRQRISRTRGNQSKNQQKHQKKRHHSFWHSFLHRLPSLYD